MLSKNVLLNEQLDHWIILFLQVKGTDVTFLLVLANECKSHIISKQIVLHNSKFFTATFLILYNVTAAFTSSFVGQAVEDLVVFEHSSSLVNLLISLKVQAL